MPITFQDSQPAPQEANFVSLASHEAKTPDTFFGGQPVLHNHIGHCDVTVKNAPTGVLRQWLDSHALNDDTRREGIESSDTTVVKQNIDVFVTSESLALSRKSLVDPSATQDATAATLNIPYPAISLHATQRLWKTSKQPPADASVSTANAPHDQNDTASSPVYTTSQDSNPDARQMSAVYLQLDPSHHLRATMNPNEDDLNDADDTFELLLIPQEDEPKTHTNGAESATNGNGVDPSSAVSSTPNHGAATGIFEALSRCADLHPDPEDEDEDEEMDDEEGPAPALGGMTGISGFPGGGGWITADNAHEFEGQFAVDVEEVGDGVILGPGAGTRRARDADAGDTVDGEGNGGQRETGDGEGSADDKNKYQKTS